MKDRVFPQKAMTRLMELSLQQRDHNEDAETGKQGFQTFPAAMGASSLSEIPCTTSVSRRFVVRNLLIRPFSGYLYPW
jgi:hypothetical protein